MKKMSFILLLLLFLSITACSNDVTSYRGESKNWRVLCSVQSNNSSSSYEYSIRYLGDNPSIDKVNYKFMSENIKVREEAPFNTVIKGKAENRSSFLKEDEFIVEIDWDGDTEKVIVKKQ
ncbi:hypothetical protein V6669_20265 [Paenibacillus sp. Y5S-9]|uniref:hypothetical protein n=1 Tax=Paenibacillus sp. Y5S-9 TaxID=3122489 RepID=UPI0030D4D7EF